MLFSQVAGQGILKKEFIQMVNTHSLPHAIMLYGKEGVGGLPLAIACAQYLLCEAKGESDACGQCASCIKVAKLVHPDLHLTFPAIAPKPGVKALSRFFVEDFRTFVLQSPYGTTFDWLQFINADNKQGNIPAEECREIINNLNLKAFEGSYKIQIIWRPEYLGKEGNILLKLIEEPPADTIIILVAEDVDNIIQTILSRTQLLSLKPLSTEDIAQALHQRNNIEVYKANQIALLAEGSYTKALSLLRMNDYDMLHFIKEWLSSIINNDGLAINKYVEELSKQGREMQKNTLLYLQQILSYTMRASVYGIDKISLPDEETQFVKSILQYKWSLSIYQLCNERIDHTVYHIERNANSKIQLMYFSIQMQYHIKERSLQSL